MSLLQEVEYLLPFSVWEWLGLKSEELESETRVAQ